MTSSAAVKSLFDEVEESTSQPTPAAAPQATPPAPAKATVTDMFETAVKSMADLFKCRGNRTPTSGIPVRVHRSMMVPALKEYIFDADILKFLVLWFMGIGSKNFYVGGPRGCGKSTMIEQFAARVGLPVFRLGCHGGVEEAHMRGQWILTVKDGHQVTTFTDGPLIRAMREGGIFLLDEGDSLNPSVLLGLNTVLDGGPVLIPETGELVTPHPNFRVAMTGNTMLDGGMGKYKGTVRQNEAVADRFFKIRADYMPWDEEALVIRQAVPKLGIKLIEALVKMARDMRIAAKEAGNSRDTKCELDISTRGLIRAASAMAYHVKNDVVSDEEIIRCLNFSILEGGRPEDVALALDLAAHCGLIKSKDAKK